MTQASRGPGSHDRRRTALVAALCAVLCASCAQKGFPPGGPADVTPPGVLQSMPDSGATRVPPGSPISITFDDKMDRRSVEAAFFVTPPTDMGSLKWMDRVVMLTSRTGLVENRTYTVLLGLGMKDRRGNKMKSPVLIHFSTGDSVAPGVVRGNVETGRARAPSVMVWAYPAERCPPELGLTIPEGVGQAGSKGEFFIGGLDTEESYCVYAHLDRNGNNELDENDLFIGADSTVVFEADSSVVSGVTIFLVPDDEPGNLNGTVVDSSGPDISDIEAVVLPDLSSAGADSAVPGAGSVAEPAEAQDLPGSKPEDTEAGMKRTLSEDAGTAADSVSSDSTRVPAVAAPVDTMALKRAIADSVYSSAKIVVVAVDMADSANYAQTEIPKPGTFSLKGLPPGEYRLTAFRDLNKDKTHTAGVEPVAWLEAVAVRPGRSAEADTLVLRRRHSKVKEK